MEKKTRFWFSPKNLARTVRDILLLFSAVDQDMDDVENALNGFGTRISSLEEKNSDEVTYRCYDPLADETFDLVRDSDGQIILSGNDKLLYLTRVTEDSSES